MMILILNLTQKKKLILGDEASEEEDFDTDYEVDIMSTIN